MPYPSEQVGKDHLEVPCEVLDSQNTRMLQTLRAGPTLLGLWKTLLLKRTWEHDNKPKRGSWVFMFWPGDVLYVPRGFVHEAKTSSLSSLHLTVAIPTFEPWQWRLKRSKTPVSCALTRAVSAQEARFNPLISRETTYRSQMLKLQAKHAIARRCLASIRALTKLLI